MHDRIGLHTNLMNILGSNKVYYQPPESIRLEYPCILYELDDIPTSKANNKNYLKDKRYSITLIHKDPENGVVDRLLELPLISFDRSYQADNLHHFVFTLYD